MAIYHASVKSFSRGKGESSVAAAAYRAGLDLTDERTGVVHRYAKRGGVVSHHMLAPKGAPAWILDPQKFWNANEAGEARANARVAREVEVSLPNELSIKQRERLALDLGEFLVQRYKAAVLVAIHEPSGQGDQRNHHVHLLMSARKVNSKGLGDRAGEAFDARQGGGTRELRQVRKEIAQVINAHLKRVGVTAHVDHRSLKAQARDAALKGDFDRAKTLTRKPTKHLGKTKVALSRKAQITATLYGKASQKDALALATLVRRTIEQDAKPFEQEAPDSHSHVRALQDRAREEAREVLDDRSPVRPDSPVWRAKQRLMQADQVPSGRSPRRTGAPYSGLTLHLSRVGRITRATGRDAEVLNAEAELIEKWLEAQRQAAQESLELLRQIPGIQIEQPFLQAHTSLVCRRVDAYLGKQFLFEDTEILSRAMHKYARMMLRPYQARMKLLTAKATWSEHEETPATAEAMRARQLLYRARVQVSKRVVAIQERRIAQARTDMEEARDNLEKKFRIDPVALPVDDANMPSAAAPVAQEGEGHLELRLRIPRPTL